MPAALRNQRAPTAGDTPAPTAASSLEHPAAMAAQNRWRSSRRATEGRPSEGKAPRPDRSERRFRMAIATSSLKVLRRPLEPGQHRFAFARNGPATASAAFRQVLATAGVQADTPATVLCDGDAGLWRLQREVLPSAMIVLDWWHAAVR